MNSSTYWSNNSNKLAGNRTNKTISAVCSQSLASSWFVCRLTLNWCMCHVKFRFNKPITRYERNEGVGGWGKQKINHGKFFEKQPHVIQKHNLQQNLKSQTILCKQKNTSSYSPFQLLICYGSKSINNYLQPQQQQQTN